MPRPDAAPAVPPPQVFDGEVVATEVTITERGEDHAVYRTRTRLRDGHGRVTESRGEFTVIGHSLHYLEAGEWRPTDPTLEDLASRGAIARHGPHQVSFASHPGIRPVFTIQMADGRRWSGGPRALGWIERHGRSFQSVASIRPDSRGRVVAPDQFVFEQAFDGVEADLVYVWRRDAFQQDVLLRAIPAPSVDWDPSITDLAIVSEFTIDPPLECAKSEAQADLDQARDSHLDDARIIDLGRMSMVVGRAFPAGSKEGFRTGAGDSAPGAVPVRKRWQTLAPGHYRLLECVPWRVVKDHVDTLPGTRPRSRPRSRTVRDRAVASTSAQDRRASQSGEDPSAEPVPSNAQTRHGFVVDFLVIPQNQITTFQKGFTYYLQSPYQITAPTRVESGTILKYANGAELRMLGPIEFPLVLPYAILTSRNDDMYGERIAGIPGDEPSNGDPTNVRASAALFVDQHAESTVVRNVRIRWAQTCLRYAGTAANIGHVIEEVLMEHSDNGVTAEVPQSSAIGLKEVRVVNVRSPLTGGAYRPTPVLPVTTNATDWPHHQAEPAIAVRLGPGGDIYNATVVVAALSRRAGSSFQPDLGIVRSISRDGGRTWPVSGYIATGLDLPQADGDADPCLVYDDFNNLYLAYRSANPEEAVCALSEDDGLTWRIIPGFDDPRFKGFAGATPRLGFGRPAGQAFGNLWVTLQRGSGGELQCAGTEVRGPGHANVGGSGKWVISGPLPDSANVKFHSIAVGPAEEVVIVTSRGNTPPEYGDAPVTFHTLLNAAGYPSAAFEHVETADFTLASMGETVLPGAFIDPLPVLAWDRPRNRLYLAYTSRAPSVPETETRAVLRIFSWTAPRQWGPEVVLQTASPNSQFHARVAVDEGHGAVAAIWYDRKDDPANLESHVYAALSRDGFQNPASVLLVRVSPVPASHANAGYDLKEYIGLAALGGFCYPAWTGNGSRFGAAWDALVARVPF